tara:strand:- start:42 stop:638 length:597 start_codon:yes stop_codon:yes gene_type:complete
MKKIYFDGCSWTKGMELNDPLKERYSKLICDEVGAEEINFAMGGGSNDRVVRNLLVENNIEDYDLAIIQMTFPVRTEYYDKDWVRVNPKNNFSRWLNGEGGDIRRLGEKFSDHSDFWKYWYMQVSNKEYFETKENIHFQTIRNHCKTKGVPLILSTINRWSKLKFDFLMRVERKYKAEYGHPNKEGHRLIAKKILDRI